MVHALAHPLPRADLRRTRVPARRLAVRSGPETAGPIPPLSASGRWLTTPPVAWSCCTVQRGVEVVAVLSRGLGFGDDDAASLQGLGFNAVRLGVVMEGLIPAPRRDRRRLRRAHRRDGRHSSRATISSCCSTSIRTASRRCSTATACRTGWRSPTAAEPARRDLSAVLRAEPRHAASLRAPLGELTRAPTASECRITTWRRSAGSPPASRASRGSSATR